MVMGASEIESGGPGFPQAGSKSLTRRSWLRFTAGGVIAAGAGPVPAGFEARGDEEGREGRLIVRSRRPLDLETPVTLLDDWLTPADVFFVRSHFGEPAVGLSPWTAEVRGLVDRPLTLGPDDWKGFETRDVTAVLQCSGNGRSYFRPRVPGLGWERGAVGQAEWSGVRLADVLARGGLKQGAGHVHFLGADGPPSPLTPPFLRSIPLEKALHPDTLLATRMNGRPIPTVHGGPLRLIVPGWTANHWMKWVRFVTVARDEAPGFFQQNGYKMPKVPAPPDAVLAPSDLASLTFMNVKSLITWPDRGAKLAAGRQEIRGVAWTGDGVVEKVEVGLGDGADRVWKAATLVDPARPWCWRRWRVSIDLNPKGRATLAARATDSRGRTQAETSPYNRSGYLWNGFDVVTCEVG
jgi:DMSO/TMAO reductase YedYZ molybdopterin-dependent catalytic subunit